MNKLLLFIVALLVFVAGCPKPSPTPYDPINPYVKMDALDIEDGHEYTCADVCKHLFDLHCPGAETTPNGATCLDVCRNIVTSGVITWDLACRSMASSCRTIDACK